MKKNWRGLMKVLNIQHIRNNKVLYEEQNILNTLHGGGEEYILRVCFMNLDISSAYYLGMDNRSAIDVDDTLSTIAALEPDGNGYVRSTLSSASSFTLTTNTSGNHQVNSPIITFRATALDWTRSVKNLFLSTSSDSSGYLLASATLASTLPMTAGDMINVRLGLALRNCP